MKALEHMNYIREELGEDELSEAEQFEESLKKLEASDQVKEKIQLFDAIKQGIIQPDRCEHCDYCKSTKVLTNIIKSGELLYD